MVRKASFATLAVCFVLVVCVVGQQQAGRVSTTRIAPLDARSLTDAQREILGSYAAQPDRTLQLFRICVRSPEMCRAWIPASRYFASSSLSARDRELVIMRTCWLCRNEYTWGNHVAGARRAGLSDDDLLRITKGADAPEWSRFDATLIRATDSLHTDQFIPDATWKALSERFGDRELQDLIFIVGQYTFVSMWARSAGLPLEPQAISFPR
jgi:4-carboxymuconolactone decarboxylase